MTEGKEEPWYKLPPLAEEFARLLECHREVLMLRQKVVALRKEQFEGWVEMARFEGVDDIAENIRKNVVEYFEQELISIDYLLQVLNEKQREGSRFVAEMEMEAQKRKEARNG